MDHEITAPNSPALQIQLLGDIRLNYQGQSLFTIASPRLQSLLAYLLCHRAAAQSRQHLAFVFWPDLPEKHARNNLRQALFQLRQALPDQKSYLQIDANTASWRMDAPFWLDVAEFERALAAANTPQTKDSPDTLRAALEHAVTLYRGNLLPSCYDDWILPERDRLHQKYLAALEQVISIDESLGDYPAAIKFAQQLIRSDPLYEPGYRRLMRLHAETNDRNNAVRTYQACQEILMRELGVSPEPATQAVYDQLLKAGSPAPNSALASRLTPPLIGRREIWSQMLTSWARAAAGDVHLLLLTGEAGVGKTRLSDELLELAARQRASSAATRCYAAEGILSFDPIFDWLRSNTFKKGIENLEKTWQTLLLRLLPELDIEIEDLSGSETSLEPWQRQKLFQALMRGILSASQPLLLVIDDLQWCDSDTLEWLHFFLRAARGERVLLVGTLRVEEVTLNQALQRFLSDLRGSPLLTEIVLPPLSSAETALLAEEVTHRHWKGAASEALFRETEGNPLFILETLRAVQFPGGAGEGHLSIIPSADTALPDGFPQLSTRARSVIAAHIASLSAPARELAGVAAAIGRPFTPHLLALASGRSAEDLARFLEELWQRRILREESPNGYDFSHNYLRDVAYAQISPPARPLIHSQIAQALEAVHRGNLSPISAQLAAHYERAGIIEKAIEFLAEAAGVALRIGANNEVMRFMTRAVNLFETHIQVPDSADLTVTLPTGHGDSVPISQGVRARDTLLTNHRAQILAQRLDPTHRLMALRALATSYISRGEYAKSLGLGIQLLNLARRQGNLFLETDSHFICGISIFWMGDFARSQEHVEAAIRLYPMEEPRRDTLTSTQDTKVASLSRMSFNLACQGHLTQARQVSREAVSHGQGLNHPPSLGYALYWDALLHNLLGLHAQAAAKAKTLIEVAQEYNLSQWRPYVAVMQGWATAELGDVQCGVSLLQEGIQAFESAGIQFFLPFFRSLLAEQVQKTGDLHTSQALLEQALASMEQTGERWCEAELHRRMGALRLQFADLPGADAEFRRAFQIASAQGARLFALRSAVQLARLLAAQERNPEARDLLIPAIEQFTDKDGLPDLLSARAVLESTRDK